MASSSELSRVKITLENSSDRSHRQWLPPSELSRVKITLENSSDRSHRQWLQPSELSRVKITLENMQRSIPSPIALTLPAF
jgi:hypothetical protein